MQLITVQTAGLFAKSRTDNSCRASIASNRLVCAGDYVDFVHTFSDFLQRYCAQTLAMASLVLRTKPGGEDYKWSA